MFERGSICKFSVPSPRAFSVLPASVSSTSALGRTSSARATFIRPAAVCFWRWRRSKVSLRRATASSVSLLSGRSKTTKSALAMFDLPDSGRKKSESSSVEAVMSMFTTPLRPVIRASPVAWTRP